MSLSLIDSQVSVYALSFCQIELAQLRWAEPQVTERLDCVNDSEIV